MTLSGWPGDTRFLRAVEALLLHLSTTPEAASGPSSLRLLRTSSQPVNWFRGGRSPCPSGVCGARGRAGFHSVFHTVDNVRRTALVSFRTATHIAHAVHLKAAQGREPHHVSAPRHVRLLFPARVHLDAAFTEFDIHARDLIATRCAVAGKYEETNQEAESSAYRDGLARATRFANARRRRRSRGRAACESDLQA